MEQTSAVELTRRELIPLFCKLSALGCVFTDSVGLGEKKKKRHGFALSNLGSCNLNDTLVKAVTRFIAEVF